MNFLFSTHNIIICERLCPFIYINTFGIKLNAAQYNDDDTLMGYDEENIFNWK